MDPKTSITRAQLYEMVWREPMSHIAERFGISDVALRRICDRYEISRPVPGYWSKIAHGKPVEKIPLSVEKRDPAERVRIASSHRHAWLRPAIRIALCAFVLEAQI